MVVTLQFGELPVLLRQLLVLAGHVAHYCYQTSNRLLQLSVASCDVSDGLLELHLVFRQTSDHFAKLLDLHFVLGLVLHDELHRLLDVHNLRF